MKKVVDKFDTARPEVILCMGGRGSSVSYLGPSFFFNTSLLLCC